MDGNNGVEGMEIIEGIGASIRLNEGELDTDVAKQFIVKRFP